MNPKELRRKSKKELIEMKKQLEFDIMSSYSKIKPKIRPEQRKVRKKIIAQINTILNETGVRM